MNTHTHTPISSNVLCIITRTMASKKFLCFWNAFLIVILLLSSAMGSRDLSEIISSPSICKSGSRDLSEIISSPSIFGYMTAPGRPRGGNYKLVSSNGPK